MAGQPPQPDPEAERIKNMKLKDLLDDWHRSIDGQKRGFSDNAATVRQWDAQLRKSVIDLHHLEAGVEQLTETCDDIDRNLLEMERTQDNIATKLTQMEARLNEQLPKNPATGGVMDPSSTYTGAAQHARAQAYSAAIELGTLLDSLEEALDDVETRVKAGQQEDTPHPVRPRLLSAPTAPAPCVSSPLNTLPPCPPPQMAQLRQILYESLRGLQQVQHGSEVVMGQSRGTREQLGAFSGVGGAAGGARY